MREPKQPATAHDVQPTSPADCDRKAVTCGMGAPEEAAHGTSDHTGVKLLTGSPERITFNNQVPRRSLSRSCSRYEQPLLIEEHRLRFGGDRNAGRAGGPDQVGRV